MYHKCAILFTNNQHTEALRQKKWILSFLLNYASQENKTLSCILKNSNYSLFSYLVTHIHSTAIRYRIL